MSNSRRKSREDALQVLYQLDLNHGLIAEHALTYFKDLYSEEREMDEFTQRLVLGVSQNLKALDARIKEISENWKTHRMAVVDRNILRLGAFELVHCDDIPSTVSINEMIELAKHYGSENSPSFINGILDKIKDSLDSTNKAP